MRRKKNLHIGLCLLTCFCALQMLNAQSLQEVDLFVFSSGGSVSPAGSSYSMGWTIGETFVETKVASKKMTTQGFWQAYLKKDTTKLSKENAFALQVEAYPNPCKEKIYLHLSTETSSFNKVLLFNAQGKCVKEIKWTQGLLTKEVDMSAFPSGMYVFQFLGKEGMACQSVKCIKW